MGLILRIDVIAECLTRPVENTGQMAGPLPIIKVFKQLEQHIGKAHHRIDRRPVMAGHGRQRVIGAKDKTRPVDKIKMLGTCAKGGICHKFTT